MGTLTWSAWDLGPGILTQQGREVRAQGLGCLGLGSKVMGQGHEAGEQGWKLHPGLAQPQRVREPQGWFESVGKEPCSAVNQV